MDDQRKAIRDTETSELTSLLTTLMSDKDTRVNLKCEGCKKFAKKNGSKRAKISVFWPKIAVF